jgi:hypothetical protein
MTILNVTLAPIPPRFIRQDGSLTPAGEKHKLNEELRQLRVKLYNVPFEMLEAYGAKRKAIKWTHDSAKDEVLLANSGWTQEGAFVLLDSCLKAIEDSNNGVVFNWAFSLVYGATNTQGRSAKHLKKVFKVWQKTRKIQNDLTHAELSKIINQS